MDKQEHHHEAERLLSEAPKEQDSIRRGLILAEAQVHATLALSAAPGTSPPGPGQSKTSSTASTLEEHARHIRDRDAVGTRQVQAAPGGQPGDITPRSPSEGSPLPWSDGSQMIQEAESRNWEAYIKMMREPAAPAPAGQPQPLRPPVVVSRPRRRRPAEQPEDLEPAEPGEQEPDATKQPPAPDNPAGQEPGKPGKPEADDLRPF